MIKPHQPTATERLGYVLQSGGPFLTALLSSGVPGGDPRDRFAKWADSLRRQGASGRAIDAVAARLAVPSTGPVAGHYVCAADDGTAVAEFLVDEPDCDLLHVGTLPVATPLLAAAQARVPHLVIEVHRRSAVILPRLEDAEDSTHPFTTATATAEACRSLARRHRIDVIVVGGSNRPARSLARKIRRAVPVRTHVVAVRANELRKVGGLDAASQRWVADHVARSTVAALRDFRFLLTTEGAVQGIDASVEALTRGWGDLLLIHDDPAEGRAAWFDPQTPAVGTTPVDGWIESRLSDAAVRSAVLRGMDVRVLPSTGPDGPEDGLAVVETNLEPVPEPVKAAAST